MKVVRIALIGVLVVAALIAAAIYAVSDPDIPAAELEAKYAQAPSKFLTLPDGARVHVRDRGDPAAPVLVLLHGSNAALYTWEPWVERLKAEFRVVTLDLPGHGLTGPTPAGDYSQAGMSAFAFGALSALGVETFALAGNSMGAGVAARMALENPARVTRLILVDGGGMPSKRPREPGLGFRLARIPVVNNVMRWVSPRSLFENGLKTAIHDDALVTPAMVDLYWELNRREGNRLASLSRFQLPFDDYNARNMGRLAMPVLILWGDKDTLIPLDSGEAARDAIANSQLVVYRDVGHVPMEETPDTSANDVRAFLKGEAIPSLQTP